MRWKTRPGRLCRIFKYAFSVATTETDCYGRCGVACVAGFFSIWGRAIVFAHAVISKNAFFKNAFRIWNRFGNRQPRKIRSGVAHMAPCGALSTRSHIAFLRDICRLQSDQRDVGWRTHGRIVR